MREGGGRYCVYFGMMRKKIGSILYYFSLFAGSAGCMHSSTAAVYISCELSYAVVQHGGNG